MASQSIYPERADGGQSVQQDLKEATAMTMGFLIIPTTSMPLPEESAVYIEEVKEDEVKGVQYDAHKVEKTEPARDAMAQLADQIPQPCVADPVPTDVALEKYALLTREFNNAMSLPVGTTPMCVTSARGLDCGRMLREEAQEVEQAVTSGVLHDVLAELVDVLHLMLNLGQECGLERLLGFLLKHRDKRSLSWTRTAHAKACQCSEEAMKYTVSRTAGGKWLLHSKGKLIKPYDYVLSDFSILVTSVRNAQPGFDNVERVSHSSGPDTSQSTFTNIGVQASASETLPRRAGNMTEHHGWQPVLMTGMMWMANVVGEYLTRMDRRPEVSPVKLPRLIDDPVSMLEQAVVDLKLAYENKEVSGILKQLGLLLYYTMLMATTMQLHPYLSSTYLWIHEWQLSKIYINLGKAESAYEMLQDVSTKEVEDGYVIVLTKTLRVLGEEALDKKADDKADVVLMTPVESLLDLVPFRLKLPYPGLSDQRLPENNEILEMEKSRRHHLRLLLCDNYGPFTLQRWRCPVMHVQYACDQGTYLGWRSACCVIEEFIHVMRHFQSCVVFVSKPPTEVASLFDFTM